jgi:hypothetical protein
VVGSGGMVVRRPNLKSNRERKEKEKREREIS